MDSCALPMCGANNRSWAASDAVLRTRVERTERAAADLGSGNRRTGSLP